MESGTTLQYKSAVYVAGRSYSCVEDYESIHSRWRDATVKASKKSATLPEPLELTVCAAFAEGADGRPTRVAISPMALQMVLDVPEDDRLDVIDE